MTMIHHFDTNQFAKRLRTAGFEDQQVETLLDLARESQPKDMVTKEYFDNGLVQLEQRMIIKIGGLIVAAGTVLGLLGRYLPLVGS